MAYKLRTLVDMVALTNSRVPSHNTSPDILLVEDEAMSRHALAVLLRSQGFDTYATASAEEALRMIRAGAHPFVALVDLDLPGMSGIELISRLSQHNPAIPAILITAASYERLSKIVQNTNVQYMRKPINFQNLLHLLPPTDYHA